MAATSNIATTSSEIGMNLNDCVKEPLCNLTAILASDLCSSCPLHMGYCISNASQRVLDDAVCGQDEGEGSPGVVVGGGGVGGQDPAHPVSLRLCTAVWQPRLSVSKAETTP
jgi:hypothetical protein